MDRPVNLVASRSGESVVLEVEVCCLAVADEDIENYRDSGFNSDFKGIVFSIKKGDILGIGTQAEFEVTRRNDVLKHTSSIFTIAPNRSADKGPVQVNAAGDKVVILLPKAQFQKYVALKINRETHPILNCCLIIPALTYLLEEMRSGRIEEDWRWYVVLRSRLKDIGVDPDDIDSSGRSTYELAQLLIGSPFEDAVSSLERMLTDE